MYLYRTYGYRGLPVSVGSTDALYIKSKANKFHALYKRTKYNEKI